MSDTNVDLTISLNTAREYAKRWREEKSDYDDHNRLHGFLIPRQNLEALLAQITAIEEKNAANDSNANDGENKDGIYNLRAYIGVDENGYEKLMVVGTKYNKVMQSHDDMLPLLDTAIPGKIYDFTRPCPQSCGYMSALNDLELDIKEE